MVAVSADKVVVELEARLARYDADVRRSAHNFEENQRRTRAAMAQTEASIRRSTAAIRTALLASASAFAGAFGVTAIMRLADGYTRFTNQLRVAGLEGENLADVQGKLFTMAQRYGVELEGLGTLYGRTAQGARELGATQAELLQFTSGVAAAIRIQGASTESARGALLQLTQALGGEIVRAEEFNSINEGARPILQAVANGIDKYAGSVARLRRDVIEGEVTSREFFRAFLAGTAELEERALRSNMTIGMSFQVLNNALGQYIGQTDQALSATQRISAGINALANNLDTIIPALAVIIGLLGARYLGVLAGATAATVAKSVATARATVAATSATVAASTLATAEARLTASLLAQVAAWRANQVAATASTVTVSRAAVAMTVASTAASRLGGAMLAAFGGPVGLAVAALAVGIGYLVYESAQLDAALGRLDAGVDTAATKLEEARARAEAAGVAVDSMRRETDAAHPVMMGIAHALDIASTAARNYAASAQAAAIASARLRLEQARSDLAAAEGTRRRREMIGSVGPTALGLLYGMLPGPSTGELNASIASGRATIAMTEQELALLMATPAGAFETGGGRAPSGGGSGRPKRKGRGRQGPDPEDITRRYEDDVARATQRLAEATAELAGTRSARVGAELSAIEADRQQQARQIEGNEHYSEARKQVLLGLNDQVAAQRRAVILAEEADAQAADRLAVATSALEGEIELEQILGRLAETNAERRDSAMVLLDLSQQRERLELDAIIASRTATEAEKEIARARLRQLDRIRDAETANIVRDTESPIRAYRRSITRTAEQMNEDFERIAVSGLEALNDGITDAIMGSKSLGEAFHNVANQIIADLVRIAVQQLIIKPLMGQLFGAMGGGGGGGGGGLLNVLASVLGGIGGGKALGGKVVGGTVFPVGERGIELFKAPMSGEIIPTNQLATSAGESMRGGDTVLNVEVIAPGANAQTVELIRQTIADTAPTLIAAAQRSTMRALGRKRMT